MNQIANASSQSIARQSRLYKMKKNQKNKHIFNKEMRKADSRKFRSKNEKNIKIKVIKS